MVKTTELTINLEKKAETELKWLQKRLGSKSLVRAIRDCVSIMRFLEKKRSEGYELILRRKSKELMITPAIQVGNEKC